MVLTAPDWLKRHDGDVKLCSDGTTWYVVFGGKPLYGLMPRPIGNRFGCGFPPGRVTRRAERDQYFAQETPSGIVGVILHR